MDDEQEFPIVHLSGESTVNLDIEQRYRTLAMIFRHQFFSLYTILGERYGWEAANEIAGSVPDPSVPHMVAGYQRKFDLEGTGAEALSKVFQAEFQSEGSDVEVISESEESAEFEVRCFFGNALQEGPYTDVPIEDGLCHTGCLGWMNQVGATVSPAVTVERCEWMGDGAPRCRFLVEAAADNAP